MKLKSSNPIKIKDWKPLPDGRYSVAGEKKPNIYRDWPEGLKIRAVCKNEWVQFYHKRQMIWECNAVYAALHYFFTKTS